MNEHRGSRISNLSLTSAQDEEWVVNATPRPLYPREKTRYPQYRRLGVPQGRSERWRKTWRLPRFDPRTIQAVARCYRTTISRFTLKCPDHMQTEKYIASLTRVSHITPVLLQGANCHFELY